MTTRGKVLLVGDSISIGYHPYVAEDLAPDGILCAHHEGNSGDSAALSQNLDAYLAADADAALIHFNVGLHDLRFYPNDHRYQVPLEAYRENLAQIVQRLKATGKPLVWASTTPVVEARIAASAAEFVRRDEDVRRYNAAAAEIVAAAGIATDDLYATVAAAGVEETLCPDGTHMTDAGYRLLARAVAQSVRDHWPA